MRKKVMMSLMLMTFLSAVEGTIVSTAIPRITSDLSGVELVSWVYAIYMLATAVSTPIYGKLADLFGRKSFTDRSYNLFSRFCTLRSRYIDGTINLLPRASRYRCWCCYANHNDDYWRLI